MIIQFYPYHLPVQKLRASTMRHTFLLLRLYMLANNDKISSPDECKKALHHAFSILLADII